LQHGVTFKTCCRDSGFQAPTTKNLLRLCIVSVGRFACDTVSKQQNFAFREFPPQKLYGFHWDSRSNSSHKHYSEQNLRTGA